MGGGYRFRRRRRTIPVLVHKQIQKIYRQKRNVKLLF